MLIRWCVCGECKNGGKISTFFFTFSYCNQFERKSFFFSILQVYVGLFKPLRVSRHQFKKIINCMKLIRSLKYQEVYAQERVTKVDSLSLVLSGK